MESFRSESPKNELLQNVESLLCDDRAYFEAIKKYTIIRFEDFFSQKLAVKDSSD